MNKKLSKSPSFLYMEWKKFIQCPTTKRMEMNSHKDKISIYLIDNFLVHRFTFTLSSKWFASGNVNKEIWPFISDGSFSSRFEFSVLFTHDASWLVRDSSPDSRKVRGNFQKRHKGGVFPNIQKYENYCWRNIC